VQEQNDKLESL